MDLGAPTDWHYLAEGGANLVLSYRGPAENSHLLGRVLRLRKRPRPRASTQQKQQQQPLFDGATEGQDPAVFLYRTAVSKLFNPPDEAVARLQEVVLPAHFLERGQPVWALSRPQGRTADDELDLSRKTAVLAESMVQSELAAVDTSLDILAVEIKPKWGFMPNTQFLSPETVQAKSRRCRYCRHAQAKGRRTTYCPLDLFSQNLPRVKTALRALFEDWHTSQGHTNNFRVFVNGHRVQPDSLTELEALLSSFQGFSASAEASDTGAALVDLLAPVVSTSPVLHRLRQLQSTFDPIDIEGVAQLLRKQCGVDLAACQAKDSFLAALQDAGLAGEPTRAELEALVDLAPPPLQQQQQQQEGGFRQLDETSDVRSLLVAYLLSAAFKDCSFFITFTRRTSSGRRDVAIKLVDVDLKSVCRLPHYYALDRKLAVESADD